MHVRSFGILAVIGVGVAVGCHGGGGDTSAGTYVPNGGYEAPPGAYDTPGSSWDQPPADDDTPPSGFDTPPGGGSGSASTRRVCESICRSLLANGCAEGSLDQAGCAQSCSEGITEAYDVCLEELLGVVDCVLRSPSFDCESLGEGGELDQATFAECEVPALQFATCQDVEGGPEPGPDDGLGGAGNL